MTPKRKIWKFELVIDTDCIFDEETERLLSDPDATADFSKELQEYIYEFWPCRSSTLTLKRYEVEYD